MEALASEKGADRHHSESVRHGSRIDWGNAGVALTVLGAAAIGWVWFVYTEVYGAVGVRPEEIGLDPLRVLSVTAGIMLALAALVALPLAAAIATWRRRWDLAVVVGGAVLAILIAFLSWAPTATFYVLIATAVLALGSLVPYSSRARSEGFPDSGLPLAVLVPPLLLLIAGYAATNAGSVLIDTNAPSARPSLAGAVLHVRAPSVCVRPNSSVGVPTERPVRLLGTANDVYVLLDGTNVWRIPTALTSLEPVHRVGCRGNG